jgi:hypothetical protein
LFALEPDPLTGERISDYPLTFNELIKGHPSRRFRWRDPSAPSIQDLK